MSKLIPMVELKFRGMNVAMSKPQIEYLLEKGQELETENNKLKQEKNELIKWLKEEAETYRFRENYEELSMTGACEMILERLGE